MGDSYTIQISSDLIKRLVGNETKAKKAKKPKQNTQKKSHQSPNKAREDSNNAMNALPRREWPVQSPIYLPVPSAPPPSEHQELEAIRAVLQESEKVVERLEKQKENMVEELTQRAKELHDKEFKLPYQKLMPCLGEKKACQKCYEENLNNPLVCADIVKRFVDCAREARMQANSAAE